MKNINQNKTNCHGRFKQNEKTCDRGRSYSYRFRFYRSDLALGAFFALKFAKGVVGNEEIPSMVLAFFRQCSNADRIYVDSRPGWRHRAAFISALGKISIR